MTDASICTSVAAIAPQLTVTDGVITTTSLQVAEHFGKRHDVVLRAIRNLECSGDFRLRNFAESVYVNEQGKEQPCFRITRDGFAFLAMGFTGKEAAQWKEAYITAFNKMETTLRSGIHSTTRLTPTQKQHLHELVDLIAAAGKQSHAETWARLHRKFKVNKYELLRQDQFDEACAYLGGKMDGQDIGALVQKHFPNALRLEAPEPTIDPVELLTTGQSDPVEHLSSTQRTAIAQRAFTLANEAYGLIHTHIERRVAFQVGRSLSDQAVEQSVNGVTLGNALTHRYMEQVRTMQSTVHWLQVTAEQTAQALHKDVMKFGRA